MHTAQDNKVFKSIRDHVPPAVRGLRLFCSVLMLLQMSSPRTRMLPVADAPPLGNNYELLLLATLLAPSPVPASSVDPEALKHVEAGITTRP